MTKIKHDKVTICTLCFTMSPLRKSQRKSDPFDAVLPVRRSLSIVADSLKFTNTTIGEASSSSIVLISEASGPTCAINHKRYLNII